MEAERLARAHGWFNVVTGLWPVFHLRSFEKVTGPKADGWLVKTVGLLLAVIGGVQIAAAGRGRVSDEVRALGSGTAASLAAIDLLYGAKRRISAVYFLDAAGQLGWVGAWGLVRDAG